MQIYQYVDIIICFAISYAIVILIVVIWKASKNRNFPLKRENKKYNYVVLIPARYESKVIEDLIYSIEEQTYKIEAKDIYVIVESETDPTVDICKKHKVSYFVRKRLNLATKGYALDECIKQILKDKKSYDAYYIFDADNVLDKHYFEEMNKSYIAGYDITMGYRNSKNGNDNVIAAASGLVFSMVNILSNRRKSKQTRTISLTGTGFYVSGKYIEMWKGYPFNSLTEDYELTLYATVNGLTTCYNESAMFYDEQPTQFKTTIKQRTRWVKGFFDCRKKYRKLLNDRAKGNLKNSMSSKITLLSIIPVMVITFSFSSNILVKVLSFFASLKDDNANSIEILWQLGISVIIIYLILFIMTAIIIYEEKDKMNLNKKMRFKALLYYPIFLSTFVWCAIKALFTKEVKWDKIEHVRNKD